MRVVRARKQYVCGVCGQSGHNRQTCGKTVPAATPNPTRRLSSPQTVPPTAGSGRNRWEDMAAQAEHAQNQSEEPETDEAMTVEDLKTWWSLANNGKEGKYGNDDGWTSRDDDQLANLLKTVCRENLKAQDLKDFLKNFGALAKGTLVQRRDIPELVLTVLVSDKSVETRMMIAERGGLTESLMMVLAKDPNLKVKHALANNVTVPENVLQIVYDNRFAGAKGLQHPPKRVVTVDRALARNPHCPRNILNRYLTSTNTYILGGALENRQTSSEKLDEILERSPGQADLVRGAMMNPNMTQPMVDKHIRKILDMRRARVRKKSRRVEKNYSEEYALSLLVEGEENRLSEVGPSGEVLREVYEFYRAGHITDEYYVNRLFYLVAANKQTPTEVLEELVETLKDVAPHKPYAHLANRTFEMAKKNLLNRA